MFYILLIFISGAAAFLGYIYSDSNAWARKKAVRAGSWVLIIILGWLICNNRAHIGLVFNSHAPDIEFWQTIDSSYLSLLISDFIVGGAIYACYLFLNRKLKISSYWFLIALLIGLIIIYYPGVASADGDNSYNQFLNHNYGDWQPPVFTIWWNLFHFHGATFLMNMLSYYGGLIYISYYLHRNNKCWQNDLLVIFNLVPLLFTQLVIIWKDIGFVGFLIDSVAIYLALTYVQNKVWRLLLWVGYFICLFLTVGFRINGIVAILPFIFIASFSLIPSRNMVKKSLYSGLLTIVVGCILLWLNNFLVYNVFKAYKKYPQEFVMLSDTAYIACNSGESSLGVNKLFLTNHDDTMKDTICEQALNYYNFDALFNDWNNWGIAYKAPLAVVANDDAALIAKKEWIHAITNHPLTYFSYRSKFFINVLFFQYWYPSGTENSIQNYLNSISRYQHEDIKFILPLFMLIATIAVMIYSLRLKIYNISTIIILSSILQLIGWFFLLPAHAARYFLWNDIAAVLGLVLLWVKTNPVVKK